MRTPRIVVTPAALDGSCLIADRRSHLVWLGDNGMANSHLRADHAAGYNARPPRRFDTNFA